MNVGSRYVKAVMLSAIVLVALLLHYRWTVTTAESLDPGKQLVVDVKVILGEGVPRFYDQVTLNFATLFPESEQRIFPATLLPRRTTITSELINKECCKHISSDLPARERLRRIWKYRWRTGQDWVESELLVHASNPPVRIDESDLHGRLSFAIDDTKRHLFTGAHRPPSMRLGIHFGVSGQQFEANFGCQVDVVSLDKSSPSHWKLTVKVIDICLVSMA